MRILRGVVILVALVAVACDSTASPSASTTGKEPSPAASPAASADGSTVPGSSGDPGTGPGGEGLSSQALIAADVASGLIDEATSLRYRAWALFWDPRLPERYDGTGSSYEDPRLFQDIAAALPTLEGDVHDELERYLLRPTEADSPFSTPPVGGLGRAPSGSLSGTSRSSGGTGLAAPAAGPTQCGTVIVGEWFSTDWASPTPGHGIRAWSCTTSQSRADQLVQPLFAAVAQLWGPMTTAAPNGMGLPLSDEGGAATGPDQSGGNGFVDVYFVGAHAECRPRGGSCRAIPGHAGGMTPMDWPERCGLPGRSTVGCTSYIVMPSTLLTSEVTKLPEIFAHEFFHVLQFAHNGEFPIEWYHEASATWAGWHYVVESGLFSGAARAYSKEAQFSRFRQGQGEDASLLWWTAGGSVPQYTAWTWPLFQSVKAGPSSVAATWGDLEHMTGPQDYEAAIDSHLGFRDNFRDYAAANAQPYLYGPPDSSGLDDIWWRTLGRGHPGLEEMPINEHLLNDNGLDVQIGTFFVGIETDPLNAHYATFFVPSTVRQITIDIGPITNVQNADLDVIARLDGNETADDPWRRFRVAGTKLVLCRDQEDENTSYFEVVISNHSFRRDDDAPDASERLTDSYAVTGEATCDVPDHYVGTISGSNSRGDSWNGSATFDLITIQDPRGGCPLGQYCYRLVSGSVTWTCKSGSTVTVDLAPPDNNGSLELTISYPGRPDRERTYGGVIVASDKETCPLPPPEEFAVAAWTVVGWLSIEGQPPKIGAGWTLSNSYSHTGCGIEGDCGTQSWSWNLAPVFDPPP